MSNYVHDKSEDFNPNQAEGYGEPPDDPIIWTCPHCGSENTDYLSMTAIPMCGDCQMDIDWSVIASPHWERGHRCHGYWKGSVRVGHVGLSPRIPGEVVEYSWAVERNGVEVVSGIKPTLRQAKRAVERGYIKLR